MKLNVDFSSLSRSVLMMHEGFISTTSTGTQLPDLDTKVMLLDASGNIFEGCLIAGAKSQDGYYWCRFDSESSMSELIGNDMPIGWKPISEHSINKQAVITPDE